MSSLDWYKRKLGQSPQPQSTPDTWTLPRQVQPTPSYQAPPTIPVERYEAPIPDEDGQIHVGDAIVRWQGGEGMAEGMRCPRCVAKGKKGTNVFSRQRGQDQSMIKINQHGQACPPAPICFECGWRGEMQIPYGGDTSVMPS